MIIQRHKKNLPFDEQGYQLIEYEDFFLQGNKKITLKNLGEKVASINSYFFEYLKGYNIPCAYVKKIGSKNLLFLKYTEFPFKIRILNAADKKIAKIFSIKTGIALELPVLEYHYGDSKDSMITESHLISFNLCSYDDLKLMNRLCSKINVIIKSFFERRNEYLVELTCRFGKFEGKIFLIDDFSPFSMKIIKNESDGKLPDSYKIETPAQMKKYSDHLLHLTNGD
ncbi:MAG: phosphoribosylaminoimidazolesuccinocarboxamide synthase [Ignavibacteriaceae bacterium]